MTAADRIIAAQTALRTATEMLELLTTRDFGNDDVAANRAVEVNELANDVRAVRRRLARIAEVVV